MYENQFIDGRFAIRNHIITFTPCQWFAISASASISIFPSPRMCNKMQPNKSAALPGTLTQFACCVRKISFISKLHKSTEWKFCNDDGDCRRGKLHFHMARLRPKVEIVVINHFRALYGPSGYLLLLLSHGWGEPKAPQKPVGHKNHKPR